MAKGDWGFKLKKTEDSSNDKTDSTSLRLYKNRDRDVLTNDIPGAIFKTSLDNSHPLAFGYPNYYFTLKQNTHLFEYSKDGWNVATLQDNGLMDGFVGSKAKAVLKNGTLIGVQPIGNGSVIYFADDPIFREFWKNGELFIANAIFFSQD
jgi:hypothetical protein